MEYARICVETIFGFAALFLLTKVLGKTQITQITAFDFISALVLGELVGNALYDDKVGIPKIGFAVILWGILIYSTEFITNKYKGTRGILEGRPSLVIHKGRLMRDELKNSNLDINQLQHLLRSKSVFSVQDVEYAVLETDGTISVMKKPAQQNATKEDLNIPLKSSPLPMTMISDGEVLWDNLEEAGFDEDWLKQQLQFQEITDVKKVLYAEYKEGEQLFVLPF
ncbi:DUF421 domain-containing protein [Halobacillus salinarum]|uniref:DUF421 domain-containing protein n=1 Tax=Halobacillus salinarum TaxID=2932257 RepID=A0ABY4EH65_9BACI|nr:DUF421 domain-containing protein [Halobacillus salinarum]UOQ43407.1 DUF421 domain-containing protein [Halobacillus salinarum]